MKRVLLLMSTQTYRAKAYLSAAEKIGLPVTVGTDRQQVFEKESRATNLTLDFQTPDASVSTIVEFSRQFPIDAVLATEDEGSVLAASASSALGLKDNSPQAVVAARDKLRTRQLLKNAGLLSPNYTDARTSQAPDQLAERLSFPCVLKPLFLSASRGVIRANDSSEFVKAWRRLCALLREPDVAVMGGKLAKQILIEDFIPGKEVALEGLLSKGKLRVLALFDKPDPLEGPFFEETIYVTPSRLPRDIQGEIEIEVARAARALGLEEGPIHAEARINEQGIWVLEMAPRSIGGLCARTLRFGDGRSLEEVVLRHALGEDTDKLEREGLASGVMMIPIPRRGVLQGTRGASEAAAVPHVEEVRVTIHKGQEVVPLPEGNRYLGFIFARAEKPEQVENSLREAHSLLQFDITSRAS